jgi:hypothetical protein
MLPGWRTVADELPCGLGPRDRFPAEPVRSNVECVPAPRLGGSPGSVAVDRLCGAAKPAAAPREKG